MSAEDQAEKKRWSDQEEAAIEELIALKRSIEERKKAIELAEEGVKAHKKELARLKALLPVVVENLYNARIADTPDPIRYPLIDKPPAPTEKFADEKVMAKQEESLAEPEPTDATPSTQDGGMTQDDQDRVRAMFAKPEPIQPQPANLLAFITSRFRQTEVGVLNLGVRIPAKLAEAGIRTVYDIRHSDLSTVGMTEGQRKKLDEVVNAFEATCVEAWETLNPSSATPAAPAQEPEVEVPAEVFGDPDEAEDMAILSQANEGAVQEDFSDSATEQWSEDDDFQGPDRLDDE